MRQSKKGFGLAEVIVSFVLMIMLISIMAMAIRFSQNLILQAEAMRDRTNEVSLAFAIGDYNATSLEDKELSFINKNGTLTLNFTIPVGIEEHEIRLSETETLTFRVFAER